MTALLVLLIAALAAVPAASQAPEPQEPDIVLPEVILRIEDFSVERVESALPTEDWTLPPARQLPLPDRGELAFAEPALPIEAAGGPSGGLQEAAGSPALSALVELGAGSSNHVVSQVSLFRQAQDPRFRLRFLHESLDGLAGEKPGSGFNLRQDALEGALKARMGSLRLDTQGELREEERGLQGEAAAQVSRIYRYGDASAELAWSIGELWTLSGFMESSFAAQLLTGTVPQVLTEVRATPRLSLEMRLPKFWASLAGRYAYRDFLEDGPQAVNRVGLEARVGLDPLESLHLEAAGGWMWGNLIGGRLLGHQFPFSVLLSVVPSPAFSLVLEGGYRVAAIDARNLLADYPWAKLPEAILDDRGWYSDLVLGFTLKRALSLQTGAHLSWHSAQPDTPTPTSQDPAAGLFLLDQRQAVRLTVEAQLRWTPTSRASLAAYWKMQALGRLTFEPTTELRLDGEASTASGRWGGRGSLVFRIGYDPAIDYTLVPELALGAFYKASDAISLILEGEDLLVPLAAGGKRWFWPPFVEPGIRGTFKVQINL